MKTVVLCGSRRFKPAMREFAQKLRKLGVTVYEPPLYSASKEEWDRLSKEQQGYVALGLTHNHFYKIKMADAVYVYNKDGYSGNSVTLEIGYAVAAGKPIYAYENDEEICRQVLFREIIKTPRELIKRLK